MNGKILEKTEYRDKNCLFEDRTQAGIELAEFLAPQYANAENCMVLAVPAGGVPVGVELKKRLTLPFDIFLVRKAQIPWSTEAGFGAVTLHGEIVLNDKLIEGIGLSEKDQEKQINKVKAELYKRNRLFRGEVSMPQIEGKDIILTDDGLASGFTILTAVKSLRRQNARHITIAVPTAPIKAVRKLAESVNTVCSLHIQYNRSPFAVASAYRNWKDLSNEEVEKLLKKE